ncbi:hypothetical protein [Aureispira anguillae]|uniref:Uncharacterized protein n=1 Tax=Aureispira anguillae TaxID=2864201 RepID=A0A915YCF9_9BACT|nr:hypothetical protein [Aureispira anguillae]BDS10522.1 hypothetical protein AsAng_0012300 [Aureispira anguillae]
MKKLANNKITSIGITNVKQRVAGRLGICLSRSSFGNSKVNGFITSLGGRYGEIEEDVYEEGRNYFQKMKADIEVMKERMEEQVFIRAQIEQQQQEGRVKRKLENLQKVMDDETFEIINGKLQNLERLEKLVMLQDAKEDLEDIVTMAISEVSSIKKIVEIEDLSILEDELPVEKELEKAQKYLDNIKKRAQKKIEQQDRKGQKDHKEIPALEGKTIHDHQLALEGSTEDNGDGNGGGENRRDLIIAVIGLISTILAICSDEKLKKINKNLEEIQKELEKLEEKLKGCNGNIDKIIEELEALEKKGFWDKLFNKLKSIVGLEISYATHMDVLKTKLTLLKKEKKGIIQEIKENKAQKAHTEIPKEFWESLKLFTNCVSYGTGVYGLVTSVNKLWVSIDFMSSILNFIEEEEYKDKASKLNSVLTFASSIKTLRANRESKKLSDLIDYCTAGVNGVYTIYDNLEE